MYKKTKRSCVTRLADRMSKAAALTLIAVYMMSGFALADDTVICVAENGRVSLLAEAHAGRCVDSHRVSHSSEPGEAEDTCLSARHACRGSCVDIPVSSSTSQAQQVPEGQHSSQSPVASPCICDSFDGDVDGSHASGAAPCGAATVARSALMILRSVVIVI
jgi:hypothetical protein